MKNMNIILRLLCYKRKYISRNENTSPSCCNECAYIDENTGKASFRDWAQSQGCPNLELEIEVVDLPIVKMQRINCRNLIKTQTPIELLSNDNNEDAKSELSAPLRYSIK